MQINAIVMFAAMFLNNAACGFIPREGDLCDGFVYDKADGLSACPLKRVYNAQSRIDCVATRRPDHRIGADKIDNAADLRRLLVMLGYDFRQDGGEFRLITTAWNGWQPFNPCPSLHSDDQDEDKLIDLHPRRCVANRVWNDQNHLPVSPINGLVMDDYRSDKGGIAYGAAIPRVMGEALSAFWLRKVANILRVSAQELGSIPSIPGHCDDMLQEGCSLTRKNGTAESRYEVNVEIYSDHEEVRISRIDSDKGQYIGSVLIGHWTM